MKIDNHEINLIIFDMDGVMFDTERLAYNIQKELGKKYKYKIDLSFFKKTIGLNSKKTGYIYKKYFGDGLPYKKIREEREQIMRNQILSKGAPLKEGLYELLDYIKSIKIRLALVTESGREKMELLLEQSGTKRYFDVITCSDETTIGKPDPGIFLQTAQKIGCLPENCIVLEDSENGIRAANMAGMLAVMIPDMDEPGKDIETMLFKKFNNLIEVRDYFKHNLRP